MTHVAITIALPSPLLLSLELPPVPHPPLLASPSPAVSHSHHQLWSHRQHLSPATVSRRLPLFLTTTVRQLLPPSTLLPSPASLHLPSLTAGCNPSSPLLSLPSLLPTSQVRREQHRKSLAANRDLLSFPYCCHLLLPLGIRCRVSPDPSRCPHLLPLLPSIAFSPIRDLPPPCHHRLPCHCCCSPRSTVTAPMCSLFLCPTPPSPPLPSPFLCPPQPHPPHFFFSTGSYNSHSHYSLEPLFFLCQPYHCWLPTLLHAATQPLTTAVPFLLPLLTMTLFFLHHCYYFQLSSHVASAHPSSTSSIAQQGPIQIPSATILQLHNNLQNLQSPPTPVLFAVCDSLDDLAASPHHPLLPSLDNFFFLSPTAPLPSSSPALASSPNSTGHSMMHC
ncbi:hypothetical protein B296_00013964 [Ensete ventricosum]|uniref:Uncharacterized protein n=1 Tax=Ensete ventricosum TaxID=4639 RepID=A0A426XSW6_ENSVE|nr:hypothetical protein B296_00013964 [Ensete ventricosum]